jgi:large subunit ribosomal protein L2
MPIRKYKPTSAGRRFQTVQTFDDITTTEPYKPLVEPIRKSGGRNNHGELARRRPQARLPHHRFQA